MSLATVRLGGVEVSRLILGGNPFSGFSHQSAERDDEMRRYYTAERIKAEYRLAESLGVRTYIGRSDRHISRVLLEYHDEGGEIQWIAQTAPELGPPVQSLRNIQIGSAVGAFIHGGQMARYLAQGNFDEAVKGVEEFRQAGLAVGVAGHSPKVFDWAEKNLDVDFYMCCYYDPSDRRKDPRHVPGADENWRQSDRDAMVERIATLSKPAIHYKIFAAGRTGPREAFDFVARHLRPQDAVCVGIFSKDNPNMLAEDVALLTEAIAAAE